MALLSACKNGLVPECLNNLFERGLFNEKIKTIFTFTFLAIFSVVIWTSGCSKNKFETEVEKKAGAMKLVREVQRGGYDVVTTEELKKWIDTGKDMVIVDTMPFEDSYKKMHVPGAVHFLFPIPDINQWDTKETDGKSKEDFAALLGQDKNKTIVIYCGFVKCSRSHNGATWAKKLG